MNQNIMNIIQKRLSRKQFIFSIASIFLILFMGQLPQNFNDNRSRKNNYGNNSYGGNDKV